MRLNILTNFIVIRKVYIFTKFAPKKNCVPYEPLSALMAGPVAMGWHGVAIAIPGQQDDSFSHPWGHFPTYYCYFIFVFKERFPETYVELNLGLCDILMSSSMSSSTHSIQ